jgi:hypothetical protein
MYVAAAVTLDARYNAIIHSYNNRVDQPQSGSQYLNLFLPMSFQSLAYHENLFLTSLYIPDPIESTKFDTVVVAENEAPGMLQYVECRRIPLHLQASYFH